MFGCSQNTIQKLKRNKIITAVLSFVQKVFGALFSREGGNRRYKYYNDCLNILRYNFLGGFIVGMYLVFE